MAGKTYAAPPPTAPSNPSAAEKADGIRLSWSAPSKDANSVIGCQILCHLPKQGELGLAVYATVTGTSHMNTAATVTGEAYVYRVTALPRSEGLAMV